MLKNPIPSSYLFVNNPVNLIQKMSFILDRVGLLLLILVIGVCGVSLAACSNVEEEQTSEPIILLEPQMGEVNTEVVVNGEHFPAGTAVMLRLGPPDVGATPFSYATGVADAEGGFNLTFTIPESWPDGTIITESSLTVIVLNEDGSVKATAPFALEPGMVTELTPVIVDGVVTPDELLIANEDAIVNAVKNYLVQSGESVQMAVAVEAIEGEFTRVNIVPLEAGDQMNLSGYLKLVNGVWEVLVIGRDFDPDQLLELGIPVTILPKEMLTPEG